MAGTRQTGTVGGRALAISAVALWCVLSAGALGTAATADAGPWARGDVPDSLPTSGATYRPPVDGAVTRLFDPPAVRWGSGHRGVDLAAGPGAPVRSPAAGVVAYAGPVAGRGVVTVLHDDGLRSSLEPVDADVAPGDRVVPGTVLGTLQDRSGHEGVHWGVRDGDAYLDPLSLLARTSPVVLLPPAD